MKERESLVQTIIPLRVANTVLGMGIFQCKTTRWKRILNSLYSLSCIVAYSFLVKISASGLTPMYVKKQPQSGATVPTFAAIFYGNALLTLCIVVAGWVRVKAMRTIAVQVSNTDETMAKLGIPKSYKLLFKLQLYWFAFLIVAILIFVGINYTWLIVDDAPFGSKVILVIVIHYPVALMGVADVSFYYWVRYTRLRLYQLNELLRGMLTTSPQSPQHKRVLAMKYDQINKDFSSPRDRSRSTNDNADTMKAVKQVHLELVKSARNTNEAYGVQILVTMTGSFVLITGLLYNAYTIVWKNISKEEFIAEMVPVCSWILFYAFKIFVINHSCAKTSTEAANTGDIICELYEPSTSREFRAEIRDFTLQLIQNPLTFTACGFFDLDHTFIQGVIGSITTYLVILIQVGEMPKPEELFENSTETTSVNSTIFKTP